MTDQTATVQLQFALSRALLATPLSVWQAWTDPELVAKWFHPSGVTCPRELLAVDPREGGRYEYTLITPDGRRFPSHGEYLEFVRGEKVVFSWHEPGNLDAPPAIVIANMLPGADGGCQLDVVVLGRPGAPGDQAFYDAWAQQLDHLEALFT